MGFDPNDCNKLTDNEGRTFTRYPLPSPTPLTTTPSAATSTPPLTPVPPPSSRNTFSSDTLLSVDTRYLLIASSLETTSPPTGSMKSILLTFCKKYLAFSPSISSIFVSRTFSTKVFSWQISANDSSCCCWRIGTYRRCERCHLLRQTSKHRCTAVQ